MQDHGVGAALPDASTGCYPAGALPAGQDISVVNVLVAALDRDVLPEGGKGTSTKDFTAMLPSAVQKQALRDACSVWNRSFALRVLPVLRTPICQWNNQNWRMDRTEEGDRLIVPVCQNGKVGQTSIRCALHTPQGAPGLLRIKRKRGKWIAEIAYTLAEPEPTTGEAVMGIDLGVKVPAVIHIVGKGHRFFGKGRMQRAKRRQCSARRKRPPARQEGASRPQEPGQRTPLDARYQP